MAIPVIGPLTSALNAATTTKSIVDMYRKNKKFNPADPNSQRYEPVSTQPNYSPAPSYTPAPPAKVAPVQPVTPLPARQPVATPTSTTPGAKMATVRNDAGDRRAVAVDSEEAKALMRQGYRLEQAGEAPSTNIATTPASINTSQPIAPVTTATAQDTKVETPNYQELARQAAEAGLPLDDYLSMVNVNATPTEDERKKVLDGLGIPNLVNEYYDKPSLDTQKLYTDKFNEIGLDGIKQDIAKLDAEVASIDSQFNEAFQEYNNNPFLSAGTRDFRIRTAMEARDRKIANINNRRASYVDLYNRGLDELDKFVTSSATQYEADRTMTAEKLNYLFTEANRVLTKTEEDEKGQQTLRYVPEFLKAVGEVKRGEKNQTDNAKATKELEKKFTAPFSDANFDAFASALVGQESGGDTNARNARTGAYGAFQIMPENWEPWSQEYLAATGQNPNQSLDPSNPENQRGIARFKMQQYYQKYGNWADVASMWYSGRPFYQVVQEGWADEKQGNGDEPSVREYVNSVITRSNLSSDSGRVTPQNKQATEAEKRAQRAALKEDGFSPTQVQKIEQRGLLFSPYDEQLAGVSEEAGGNDNPYA